MLPYLRCKLSSKGQVTLPKELRDRLSLDQGTVLEIGLGREGEIILRKQVEPGFFDQFVGLLSKQTPFPTGDEARESMRVFEAPETLAPRRKSK